MARNERKPASEIIVGRVRDTLRRQRSDTAATFRVTDQCEGELIALLSTLAKMTMTVSQAQNAVRELAPILREAQLAPGQSGATEIESAIDSLKRDYHFS